MTDGFKIGHIVWLKTGGPAMVINNMYNGTVDLVWFDSYGCFSTQSNVSLYALTNFDPNKEPTHD